MCRRDDEPPAGPRPGAWNRESHPDVMVDVKRVGWILIVTALTGCSAAATASSPRATPEVTVTSAVDTPPCGPERSQRDAASLLVGTTGDSTSIRVGAPSEVRAGAESTFEWHMTGNENDTLIVYAEQPAGPVGAWGRLPRVDPVAIEPISRDTWVVRLTLPAAGCWRLHSGRAGGKLAGDIWIDVLPG